MEKAATHEISELLVAWSDGDESALERLMPLVYDELHRLAHRYMRGERAGHALQTTALVNEAYMRLVNWRDVRWQNRAHFFGVSAQMMRRILVDVARDKKWAKRGGDMLQVSLSDVTFTTAHRPDLIALDDALTSLGRLDPRKAKVVEMRFFGGLSVEEVAEVLKVSDQTVMRDWKLAKVWLLRELDQKRSSTPDE